MPAPGDQHLNSGGRTVVAPFEPRISEYTAQEVATIQTKLERKLGPEFISSRSGPGGGKVHYLAAEKCIQLANEVFGFNGWSSQIKETQVDYVDEHPQTGRFSIGLSVTVRVILRDGTFREDTGYGQIENCKTKGAAFEKAKKEGTTDGLKRALRIFGNVLGNCLYDKEYLSKITKVKVQPTKWDVAELHRRPDQIIKKEPEETKHMVERAQSVSAAASVSTEDTFGDEFGDFDEADFSVPELDAHPDEAVIPEPAAVSHHPGGIRSGNAPGGTITNQNRPSVNHPQPVRPLTGMHSNNHNGGPIPQPQTPKSGFSRSNGGAGQMRPPQDSRPAQTAQPLQGAQVVVAGQVLNQPSRMALNQPSRTNPPSAPASPAHITTFSDTDNALPPPGAGFFSARAAGQIPESSSDNSLPQQTLNLPAFNPHADSPSIRKTAGVDHTKTKPTTRDLKHVAPVQTVDAPARGSIVNPQLNNTRRIGAPAAMGGGSPMANRVNYKPPTMKRPVDGTVAGGSRVPLGNLPANGPVGAPCEGGDGGDVKRQRLNE